MSLIGADKNVKSSDKIQGKNFLMSLSGIAGLGLQNS